MEKPPRLSTQQGNRYRETLFITNLQKDFEGMVAEIEQEQQEILKENKHANTN